MIIPITRNSLQFHLISVIFASSGPGALNVTNVFKWNHLLFSMILLLLALYDISSDSSFIRSFFLFRNYQKLVSILVDMLEGENL